MTQEKKNGREYADFSDLFDDSVTVSDKVRKKALAAIHKKTLRAKAAVFASIKRDRLRKGSVIVVKNNYFPTVGHVVCRFGRCSETHLETLVMGSNDAGKKYLYESIKIHRLPSNEATVILRRVKNRARV